MPGAQAVRVPQIVTGVRIAIIARGAGQCTSTGYAKAIDRLPNACAVRSDHIVERASVPVVARTAGFQIATAALARRDLVGIVGTTILRVASAVAIGIAARCADTRACGAPGIAGGTRIVVVAWCARQGRTTDHTKAVGDHGVQHHLSERTLAEVEIAAAVCVVQLQCTHHVAHRATDACGVIREGEARDSCGGSALPQLC